MRPDAPRALSPPDVAARLGVNVSKILTWIRRGELVAVNVAASRTGRPRWRITAESLDRFMAARSSTPAPAPTTRRRRKPDANVTQFY